VAIDPQAIESLNGLCLAYARSKQSQQALDACTKARAVKDSVSSSYYLAWSYLDLKKYPEAITLLNDCVRRDPKQANLYVALAEGYYRMNRLKDALASAQVAIQISPNSQAGYATMGFIYFEMKKVKDARRFFEKAVSLEPRSSSARFNLAMTCLAMKQQDCAREQYAILKTSEPALSTQLLDSLYSSKVIRLVK